MSVIDNSCTSIAPSSLLYDGDTFSQAPTAFIDLGEASTYGQPIASGGLHNYTSDVESYNTPSPACSFDFDPVSSSNSARSLSPPFELASSFQQPIQHTHYTTSSTHTKGALASLPYFHQQAQAASTAYSSAADLSDALGRPVHVYNNVQNHAEMPPANGSFGFNSNFDAARLMVGGTVNMMESVYNGQHQFALQHQQPVPYAVAAPASTAGHFPPLMSSIETPQGTFYFVPNTQSHLAALAQLQPQLQSLPQQRQQQFHQQAAPAPAPALSPVAAPAPVPSPSLAMPIPIHPSATQALPFVQEFDATESPNVSVNGSEQWEATQDQEEQGDDDEQYEQKAASTGKAKSPSTRGGKKGKKGAVSSKGQSKRFMCPHEGCGRGFARNFNMQSHLKSHLGIRDFDCPHCPKKFSRRHDRARHCSAVHDDHEDDYNRVYHDDTNLAENQRQLFRVLDQGDFED